MQVLHGPARRLIACFQAANSAMVELGKSRALTKRSHPALSPQAGVEDGAQRLDAERDLDHRQAMPWNHWWVVTESDTQKTLNIAAFPTVIMLDAKGVIRHKNIKDEELEEAVQVLLEEAKAASDPS